LAPIQVRMITIEQNIQNLIFFWGLNFILSPLFGIKTARIRIDATKAKTPPNFDGMDRNTTYANRKYHSG